MNSTAAAEPKLRKELGLRDLVLFNVAALLSTRWLAAAAHVGSGSLVLWLLAAAFFLIPCAIVVAHLSQLFPQEGGLYVWTREAFGHWHGFACAWMYYMNNLFWIPGLLISFVGMMSVAFNLRTEKQAEDPFFIVPIALLVLIGVIAANYVGLNIAKWVDNFGGLAAYGIWLILGGCAVAVLLRRHSATAFHLAPRFDFDKLNFWSQLAFGMTGLELSPILSGEIRNARQTIFRATWISAVFVVLFYVLGTSSILVLMPPANVSPVIGLSQAGQQAGTVLGWSWAPIAIGVCILLSIGGQLGTYVGGCARLPFVLGIGNLLPPAFAKLHPKFGTPYVSILFLGAGGAALLVVSQLGESFRAAYQITVDITVITLFIPFIYVFGAAWKYGKRAAAAIGMTVSAVAIVFSCLPTADVRSVWAFEAKIIGGCVLLFVLARLFYRRYKSS